MCRSRQTCGYCAQGHNTRECPNRGDLTKAKCCNCGSFAHSAWQAAKCPTYVKKHELREKLRAALALKEYRWAEEASSTSTPQAPSLAPSQKRSSVSSESGQRKRPVGRPPLGSLYDYTPDLSQPRIFSFTAGSTQPVDIEMNGSEPSSSINPPSSNED